MTIGLVTYNDLRTVPKSHIPLFEAGKRQGISIIPAPWDDPGIDWTHYDGLIAFCCWNYYQKYESFLSWLAHLESINISIINPIKTLRWNSHKQYLLDLEQRGVNIIPTILVKRGTTMDIDIWFEEFNSDHLVIKPAVSAGGNQIVHILRYHQGNKHQIATMLQKGDILIQPYVEEMRHREQSFIFLGNEYSHAIVKHHGRKKRYMPSDHERSELRHVLSIIPYDHVYARIDGTIVNDTFSVSEVELLEPDLYFSLNPKSADIFLSYARSFFLLH